MAITGKDVADHTCFGKLTAFVDEYGVLKNRERNKELRQHIQALRFGFTEGEGMSIEKEEFGSAEGMPIDEDGKVRVADDVFIVFTTADREEELKNFCKSACRYYGQKNIMLTINNETYFWEANGEETKQDGFCPDYAPHVANYLAHKEEIESATDDATYQEYRKRLLEQCERYFESLAEGKGK